MTSDVEPLDDNSDSAAFAERDEISPVELKQLGDGTGTFWMLMGCNLIVFVTSVCIMVLELTASRLLAHHIGMSLYTWTSVIGVVLAGITVGNYMGGLLADRFDHLKTLGWVFLVASILCFSVLWLDQLVSGFDRPESLNWPMWVLCTVAMVFLLPSIAMGTVSPIVASLAISKSTKTGITVGNVYAWGALGSIVGTFLAGFVLIDQFGTKSIVVMTAATLGVMGAIMAGGQRAFRTAVVLGWLQFVIVFGLAAAAERTALQAVGHGIGSVLSLGLDGGEKTERVLGWSTAGAGIGESFHELGRSLSLRSDDPYEYEDESNYSYIAVIETTDENGVDYKYLKLDKLVHSYYYPGDPTRLEYEYELVYAAVTERSASSWSREVSVEVPAFPGRDELLAGLSGSVRFEPASGRLIVTGSMTPARHKQLLELSPVEPYWRAVAELKRRTEGVDSDGFQAAELEKLPAGITIPKELAEEIEYHPSLQVLTAKIAVTDAVVEQLIDAAPHAALYRAVNDVHRRSRRVRTMFIGGGGFVFPRWIEAVFPHDPLIHVAELDPAVKLAVRMEMGLPPDDETAIKTTIGDARNFVDDQLQSQKRGTGVEYDFIYGDAFNDFSVPWHLTTKEFNDKVRKLLDPVTGVYLVNIIDIYPRTEFPPRVKGDNTRDQEPYEGTLPPKILELLSPSTDKSELDDQVLLDALTDFWTALPKDRGQDLSCFEVYRYEEQDAWRLAVRGTMPDTVRARLVELGQGLPEFVEAVGDLYRRSRDRNEGRFLGSYALTVAQSFPNVYVFSSEEDIPRRNRDTFVVIAANQPIDLDDLLEAGDYWAQPPFAWVETREKVLRAGGQWEALVGWSERKKMVLTDDFAPVDNLLSPVFINQDSDD